MPGFTAFIAARWPARVAAMALFNHSSSRGSLTLRIWVSRPDWSRMLVPGTRAITLPYSSSVAGTGASADTTGPRKCSSLARVASCVTTPPSRAVRCTRCTPVRCSISEPSGSRSTSQRSVSTSRDGRNRNSFTNASPGASTRTAPGSSLMPVSQAKSPFWVKGAAMVLSGALNAVAPWITASPVFSSAINRARRAR